jgi:hypothetical protein
MGMLLLQRTIRLELVHLQCRRLISFQLSADLGLSWVYQIELLDLCISNWVSLFSIELRLKLLMMLMVKLIVGMYMMEIVVRRSVYGTMMIRMVSPKYRRQSKAHSCCLKMLRSVALVAGKHTEGIEANHDHSRFGL